MAPKRKSERALVSIVARYRSPLIFDFVNERCYDLSRGGMFIKSNNPVNPGTLLKLECLVDDGPEKIQGVARVVWVRRVDRTEGPRGMGVKFVKLDPGSGELIDKIIENAASIPKEAESVEALPEEQTTEKNPENQKALESDEEVKEEAQETTETDRENQEASESDEKTGEEVQETTEDESTAQTTPESKDESTAQTTPESKDESTAQTTPESNEEAQDSSETADDEREVTEQSVQDQVVGEHSEETAGVAPNVAVAASSVPEHKAIVFPKWAIVVCTIALIGLIFVSIYDIDESAKSTNRTNPKRAADDSQQSSSEQVSNSAEDIDNASSGGQEVAAASQFSEPDPVKEKNDTQNEKTPSNNPLRTKPATTVNDPTQKDLKYVLNVTTSPPGAKVLANGQAISSPGSFDLGVVSSSIRVTVKKKNFHSTRVVVERSIFVRNANRMEGRIHFVLKPKPKGPRAAQRDASEETPIDSTEISPDGKPSPSSPPANSRTEESQPSETESPIPGDTIGSTSDESEHIKTTDASIRPDKPQTLFETATQCIRKGDNACAINTLKDKASNEKELGLLVETYRSVGDTNNALKYMKRYLEKYPKSRRSDSYRKIVETETGP